MERRRQIRNLKMQSRWRNAVRDSLNESLLSDAEAGESLPASPAASQRQSFDGNSEASQETAAPAVSPADRTPPRSGAALWRVARNRVVDTQMEAVPEEQELRPRPEALPKSTSIIEKFLFTLSTSPYDLEYSTEGNGATAEGGAGAPSPREPPPHPGIFSPKSDAVHLARMLWGSYLNIMLLAIPIGIAAGATGASANLVFFANFMALLPLALILGEITEDLAVRFGDTIGGLLNATFGNVVEMILGIAALSRGLYEVVAASLIGSILSNLLLVLGCCFLFGGFKHKQQRFNMLANKVSSCMLFLSAIAIIIPSAAKSIYGKEVMTRGALLNLSHAIALLLIMTYCCYLYFQLKTHADSLTSESQMALDLASSGGNFLATSSSSGDLNVSPDEEGPDVPHLSLSGAIFALSVITVTVAVCSEYLTGAIEAVSASSGINQAFLGLIVLPIAGNAAEHITAVFVAVKNKMGLAISVALGSSIQIATFVLPVTVLCGWALGKELTLDFDPFAVLMMTVSVILAYFVSSDGTSNWILGLQLVVTYILIGAVYLLEKENPTPAGPEAASLLPPSVAGRNGA